MKSLLRFKPTRAQFIAAAIIATSMGMSYAAVTVPNSFTTGTAVVAADMNANFTAVANQMPAVKTIETGGGTAIPAVTTKMMAISVTTPVAGSVVVYASGSVYQNVTAASSQMVRIKVSESSADTSETPGIQFIRNTASVVATNMFPYSIVKVFPATAGAHTYYLNMWHQLGSASGASSIDDTTLTAVFIPNALP